MFGRTWRIFRVRGIPVQVDTSWMVIAGLFVMGFYQTATIRRPELGTGGALAFALAEAAAFFGSVLFHEGAHAVVCRINDIEVRSITLFALGGFTSAHIEEKGPREEFLVAIVGPLSSLFLAAAFQVLAQMDLFGAMVTESLRNLAFVNLLLGVFNLLPGFPLDGGRVLRSAVWGATKNRRKAARVARISGQTAGVLMIGWAAWQFSRGGYGAIFTAFIGFFLFQAARQAEDAERLRAALEGSRVEDAMAPPPTSIPSDITLTEALDRFLRGNEHRMFPVCDGTRLVGVLTFDAAGRVGQHDPLRPVSDAMLPLAQTRVVPSNMSLHRALSEMENGALVVDHSGNLVGMIGPNEVQAWAGRGQPLVPPGSGRSPHAQPPAPPRPDGDDQ